MIRVSALSKHFKVAQPGRGIAGKVKRLLAPQYRTIKAVDGVSFEIEEVVAVVSLAVALAFWSFGLRHYQSTGT